MGVDCVRKERLIIQLQCPPSTSHPRGRFYIGKLSIRANQNPTGVYRLLDDESPA